MQFPPAISQPEPQR